MPKVFLYNSENNTYSSIKRLCERKNKNSSEFNLLYIQMQVHANYHKLNVNLPKAAKPPVSRLFGQNKNQLTINTFYNRWYFLLVPPRGIAPFAYAHYHAASPAFICHWQRRARVRFSGIIAKTKSHTQGMASECQKSQRRAGFFGTMK
jgi:hypothetical protein